MENFRRDMATVNKCQMKLLEMKIMVSRTQTISLTVYLDATEENK